MSGCGRASPSSIRWSSATRSPSVASSGWARCGRRSTCSRPRTPSRIAPLTAGVHRRTFRNTPFAKALDGLDAGGRPRGGAGRARGTADDAERARQAPGGALAGSGPDLARLLARLCACRSSRSRRAACGAGKGRTMNTTLEAWTGRTPVGHDGRCPGPALPAGLRPGERLGHPDLVVVHRPAGGRRAPAAAPAHLHATTLAGSCSTSRTARSPTPTVPAPVRFLPQYDNVFLVARRPVARSTGRCRGALDFVWKGPILVDGGISGVVARPPRRDASAAMTIELGRVTLGGGAPGPRGGGRAPRCVPRPRGDSRDRDHRGGLTPGGLRPAAGPGRRPWPRRPSRPRPRGPCPCAAGSGSVRRGC